MRKILFRGKSEDNGEWVYGYYACIGKRHYILTGKLNLIGAVNFEHYLVIPETVGQYTGLKDKNGKKIFEGDILRDDDNEENGVVEFIDGEFYVVFGNVETHGIYDIACCCYVIGNIHDNPELLEGGE